MQGHRPLYGRHHTPQVDAQLLMNTSHFSFVACHLSNTRQLNEMIVVCRGIDHSVAGIAHTTGGSTAAYTRWEKFKLAGLNQYAAKRNNSMLRNAVSRQSGTCCLASQCIYLVSCCQLTCRHLQPCSSAYPWSCCKLTTKYSLQCLCMIFADRNMLRQKHQRTVNILC